MILTQKPLSSYATEKVHWAPHPGVQSLIFVRPEFELGYGGARGGGKTDALIYWIVEERYIKHPLYKALILRKNYEDLIDFIERARKAWKPMGGRPTGKPAIFRFPSGAFIRLGHFKDVKSYEKYIGTENIRIGIEELQLFPRESDYEKILTSCRSSVQGLRPQCLSTFNPGDVGHVWIKKRFYDSCLLEPCFTGKGNKKISRIFIPATLDDNPTLKRNHPEYEIVLEQIKDKRLRKAWRYGDFTTFTGQFFENWNDDVHIVKPKDIRINPDWPKFRGIDFGYRAPSCCLWVAVDEMGNHYVYRELYVTETVPSRFAKMVLRRTDKKENIITTFADPSIWTKNQYGKHIDGQGATVESIADHYEREGLFCEKANNDRVNGWSRVRELLYWDPTGIKPKFFVVDTCPNLIGTLPFLVRSETKLEDIEKKGAEDHPADTLRYICMGTFDYSPVGATKSDYDNYLDEITSQDEESNNWDDV